MKKIDPAKAGKVQAPLRMRAGGRNAEAPPPMGEPDKMQDKPDGGEPDDKPADPEDRAAEQAACAEACRSAEQSFTSAAEAMGAAAKELEGGGDSLTILMAAEDAARNADDAADDAMAALAKYRGGEPPAESSNPGAPGMAAKPAPPAPDARAIASVAGASAAAQLELTQVLALYRQSGAKSAAEFGLKWQAGQTALADVAKFRRAEEKRASDAKIAEAKAANEAKIARLEAAVRAGMPLAHAFAIGEDGKRTPKAAWMAVDLDKLDAQLTEMGYRADAPPTRSTMIHALADDGEAGLAARAAASGMTVEERRAAEENQRRSREKEMKR